MDSILSSVKKMLGLAEEDDSFDIDIIIHINSALSVLTQLGVGPKDGFSIRDATPTWTDFLSDDKLLDMVLSYVYLKVRLLFDPPSASSVLEAMQKNVDEFAWRIAIAAQKEDPEIPEIPEEG